MTDKFDKAEFKLPSTGNSATEDVSIIESGPPTKLNAKPIKRVGKQKESKMPKVKILRLISLRGLS